jgi:hypothetical protein
MLRVLIVMGAVVLTLIGARAADAGQRYAVVDGLTVDIAASGATPRWQIAAEGGMDVRVEVAHRNALSPSESAEFNLVLASAGGRPALGMRPRGNVCWADLVGAPATLGQRPTTFILRNFRKALYGTTPCRSGDGALREHAGTISLTADSSGNLTMDFALQTLELGRPIREYTARRIDIPNLNAGQNAIAAAPPGNKQILARNDKIWAETSSPRWCMANPKFPKSVVAHVYVYAHDGRPIRFGDEALNRLWNEVRIAVLALCPDAKKIQFYSIPSKDDARPPMSDGMVYIADAVIYSGRTTWELVDSGYGGKKEVLPAWLPKDSSTKEFAQLLYGTWEGPMCERSLKIVFFKATLTTTVTKDHPGSGFMDPGYREERSDKREVTAIRVKVMWKGGHRYEEYYMRPNGRFGLRAVPPNRDEFSGLFLEFDYKTRQLYGEYRVTPPFYRCKTVLLTKTGSHLDTELMNAKGLDFLHFYHE